MIAVALLATTHLFLIGKDSNLYYWDSGLVKPQWFAKMPGDVLAVAPEGSWVASTAGRPGEFRWGRRSQTQKAFRVKAMLAAFDSSGKRLAVIEESSSGSYRVITFLEGRRASVRACRYLPAWLLWVDGRLVIPDEDGAAPKAVGPIPAHIPAIRASLSADGRTCALVTGSPGVFKIVVATKGHRKTYAVNQGRDIPNIATDGQTVYYSTIKRESVSLESGLLVTTAFQLDLKTGQSTRFVLPSFSCEGIFAAR